MVRFDTEAEDQTRRRPRSASAWATGAVLLILRAYKHVVSPLLPRACRFEPTCSEYMYQAIEKNGALFGLYLGFRRLLRCHPFCEGGWDPVP